MSDRRREPGALSPREAVQRYLRRRRADAADATLKSWKYQLKLWVEWTEGVGIGRVSDLRPYDIDEYYEIRSGSVAPVTLRSEMWTLRTFLKYLDQQLGAVEDDLHEAVRIPNLDPEDATNDTTLPSDDALTLLRYYRGSSVHRATRNHAFLELAWYTGARQGGLRALDIRDVGLNGEFVEFHHRPDTGTPLKNKRDGERPVAIPQETVDVLREYVRSNRYDVRDEHGRQPFLASSKGRPGTNTMRVWSYLGTQPCIHSPCPHGKDPEVCQWTEYAHASKCPSSRSPHKIRSGSITWQLNCGLPPEVVAQRVNAGVDVIKEHYDWATAEERWRRQRDRMETRRSWIDQLDLTDDGDQHDTDD